jgi:hypothetical protein
MSNVVASLYTPKVLASIKTSGSNQSIPSATIKPSTPEVVATIKTPSVSQSSSSPPLSLKNSVAQLNQSYIHNLLDVVEDNPADGSTLIYDAATNKYVVRPLTVQVEKLDGGNF